MERYRAGFRSGEPIAIETAEASNWNRLQIARSSRYLYAATNDFDFARAVLEQDTSLRNVKTHISIGEMGRAPPPRRFMPAGIQLVVQGQFDSCMLPILEIDDTAEGLTAKTTDTELLALVAADTNEIAVELYQDGRVCRGMSQAAIELFGDPADGWFRVVHVDPAMRDLCRQLNLERPNFNK